MLKKCFLVGLLSLIIALGNAQTLEKDFAVGLNIIENEYNGDYGNGIFNFTKGYYPGLGISLTKNLTHSFDVGLQSSFGKYGYYVTSFDRFTGLKFDASLFIHYNFNNGYILKKESKLSPFISVGFGLATYGINPILDDSGKNPTLTPTIITKGVDIIVPFGVGLKYKLSNSLFIQYQYQYNITNKDNHDENQGPNFFGSGNGKFGKPGNDAYGQHAIGIIFQFYAVKNKCNCNYY